MLHLASFFLFDAGFLKAFATLIVKSKFYQEDNFFYTTFRFCEHFAVEWSTRFHNIDKNPHALKKELSYTYKTCYICTRAV